MMSQSRKEDLRLYHAALALRGVQGRQFLDGKLDETTCSVILQDAACGGHDSTSVEAALLDMIRDFLGVLKVPSRCDLTEWGQMAVDTALEESQLKSNLDVIQRHAVSRKYYSILIHNGAGKVNEALNQYKGQLEGVERCSHVET